MGPEDRVEPPAAQPEEEEPEESSGPDGERRFPVRRPPVRFASHWNERWMHHDTTEARG